MATNDETHNSADAVASGSDCSAGVSASATNSTTLLSKLRAPTTSDLMRKQKVRTNESPHTGARRKKPACSMDPKGISAVQRARELSKEMDTVSAGKLFCTACREELSLKLSIIKNHVKSTKHAQRKNQLTEKRSRERDISEAFKSYEQEVHPSGETLSEAHKLWRVKVVTTFMKAGVPLAKVDHFRELLEENAYSLTDRRGICDLIPFVQSKEQQQIKAELEGKKISIIYDGTTRLGEALVIVVRFTDNFVIKQRLIRFMTLAKSMTGEEIARELISALSVGYGITPDRLVAAMRDRASVNGVATRTLKVVFPNLLDVGCYSHTIDLVGEKFRTPNLDSFIRLWVSLFSHSPRARLWWKERTGKAMA